MQILWMIFLEMSIFGNEDITMLDSSTLYDLSAIQILDGFMEEIAVGSLC